MKIQSKKKRECLLSAPTTRGKTENFEGYYSWTSKLRWSLSFCLHVLPRPTKCLSHRDCTSRKASEKYTRYTVVYSECIFTPRQAAAREDSTHQPRRRENDSAHKPRHPDARKDGAHQDGTRAPSINGAKRSCGCCLLCRNPAVLLVLR